MLSMVKTNNLLSKRIPLLCVLLLGATLLSFATTYTNYSFIHSQGLSGRPYSNNLQSVHEQTQVVYLSEGESITLTPLAATSRYTYRRWFVYTNGTEEALSSLSSSSITISPSTTTACYQTTDKGTIIINASDYPTYTCNDATAHQVIVCEQSCYKDYIIDQSNQTITEPTLSQRIIFDIRPAQEMATEVDSYKGSTAPGSYTGNYMENYTLMAPVGSTLYIGPSYQFNGGNYPNYYYTASSGIKNLSSSTTWYWNNSTSFDIANNQYIKVTSKTAGTETYTLTARVLTSSSRGRKTYSYYYIAKFTVQFVSADQYGPAESPTEALNLIDLDTLYDERFNDDAPGTTTPTYRTTPLDWDESTYGFFYSALVPDNRIVNSEKLDPTWSDYALLNSTNGLHNWYIGNVYNHGETGTSADAADGYFLFVDGAPEPGELFTIKIDTNLCPGAVMYLSTYFAAIQNSGSKPQFDFTLSGTRNGQTYSILTYATGEIETAGVWQRLVVPIELKEDYDSYSLVITNKGNNTAGNDFIFDDFQIFASKPPVRSLQASSQACVDPTGDELTTYLRITLDDQNLSGVDYLYYQWTDNADNALDMPYYRKQQSANGSYGRIPVKDSTSTYPVYASLADFDTYASNPANTPTLGYIQENGVWVLYVATRATLVPDEYYIGYVATDPTQLRNATCGLRTELQVEGSMYLTVNDERIRDGHTMDYCGNRLLSFEAERLFITNDVTGLVQKKATCEADFLWGTPDYVDANPALYNATFAEIRAAVVARQAGTANAEQTALLNALTKAQYLTSDIQTLNVYLSADKLIRSLMYTAFPIEGTGRLLDDDGNVTTQEVSICTDPVYGEVLMRSIELKALRVGLAEDYTSKDTLPDFVTSLPRVVRVSEQQCKTGTIEIPVFCNFAGDKTFVFAAAEMYETTDPNATVGSLSLPLQNTTVLKSDTKLTLTGTDQLRGGYTYTFKLREGDYDSNDCSLATETVFSLTVVPDQVVWSPLSGSTAWNDDSNWKTTDGQDAFCPLAETDVIIPAGDNTIPLPVIIAEETQKPGVHLESDAEKYISYDINFAPYTCHDIYLPANTTLLNQHYLSINGKAVVDMQVPTNKWVLCSMPLAAGVSGDFWTPSAGESTTDVFSVKTISQSNGAYASDRLDNTVWQSLYNKSMVNYGDCNVPIISSTWTEPLNALDTEYPAGVGVALWVESSAGASAVDIRLPKSDTQYKWYYNNLWKSSPVVSISRGTQYGQPAYQYSDAEGGMTLSLTNYDASGNLFLFGNPTWAYIDMEKLLAGNSNLQASYYVLTEGTQELTATVKDVAADGGSYRYLAPMRGVLLQSTSAAQSLSITITPDMLCLSPAGQTKNHAPRRIAAAADNQVLYLSVSANDENYGGIFTSRAAVITDLTSANSAQQNEDASFLLLDEWKTPFGVFTMSTDRQPLSINAQSSQDTIALGVYAQHTIGEMNIHFAGAEAADWELFDAQSLTVTPLMDDMTLPLYTPTDGTIRYYLRRTAPAKIQTDLSTAEHARVYAVGGVGEMRLFADNTIIECAIYDALGRLITSPPSSGKEVRCSLPSGVYMVKVQVGNEWSVLQTMVY